MIIHPRSDRLVVRLLPDKDNGRLVVVPDAARRDEFGRSSNGAFRGEVISVGPGKRSLDGLCIPLNVEPGDIIYFSGLNDYEFGDLMIIREADILLVEGS